MRHALLLLIGCAPVELDEEPLGDCPPDSCLEGELGNYTIEPSAERDGICFSWTIGNEDPLYINAVTADNDGFFHHSNWFWVPESEWDVADGWWDCSDHQFTELKAATRGGVLFAQSTQLDHEVQQFLPGYALEVPPRARVIAFAHLLNWSGETQTTALRTRFDLLDPGEVAAVLAPSRFSYLDLDIPAGTTTEHYGDCMLRGPYEAVTQSPFDVKLHYVLPHFHAHGTGFSASILGGPRDGESLVDISDAWGHPFGVTFDEPIDLSDADGLRLACEHSNTTEQPIGWGIGDQEMCVALFFYESKMMMESTVIDTAEKAVSGDPLARTGDCLVIGAPFVE